MWILPSRIKIALPKPSEVLSMLQEIWVDSKWKLSEMHLLVADTFSMTT